MLPAHEKKHVLPPTSTLAYHRAVRRLSLLTERRRSIASHRALRRLNSSKVKIEKKLQTGGRRAVQPRGYCRLLRKTTSGTTAPRLDHNVVVKDRFSWGERPTALFRSHILFLETFWLVGGGVTQCYRIERHKGTRTPVIKTWIASLGFVVESCRSQASQTLPCCEFCELILCGCRGGQHRNVFKVVDYD